MILRTYLLLSSILLEVHAPLLIYCQIGGLIIGLEKADPWKARYIFLIDLDTLEFAIFKLEMYAHKLGKIRIP